MRQLIMVLLPIALPVALYFGYLAYIRRRAAATGRPVQDLAVPWTLIAVTSGGALLVAVLAVWLFSTGAPPDHVFQPSRLVDGQIVPSRSVPGPRPE
jgi:uncharacterized iron-regulated membrane protein